MVTVNHDWHKSWTSSNPLFRNFYLLRDYKYSIDTFTGFEEIGTETGIQLNRVEFLDRIKQSFVQHEFVQKHFENPDEAFDQTALPTGAPPKLMRKHLSVPTAKAEHCCTTFGAEV